MVGLADRKEIIMLKIKCTRCKMESTINMYFHNQEIHVQEDPCMMTREYIARVHGHAICPVCGAEIFEHFSCPISYSDIVDLALRREVHI